MKLWKKGTLNYQSVCAHAGTENEYKKKNVFTKVKMGLASPFLKLNLWTWEFDKTQSLTLPKGLSALERYKVKKVTVSLVKLLLLTIPLLTKCLPTLS